MQRDRIAARMNTYVLHVQLQKNILTKSTKDFYIITLNFIITRVLRHFNQKTILTIN